MHFLFRAPVFPVVFNVGSGAVCADTAEELSLYLKKHGSTIDKECALIDCRWEGFGLYPKDLTVSPLTFKKRYSKRELLLFCGITQEQLAITKLNNYSREQIFDFIIDQAHKKLKPSTGG